jgi:site-specific DNA recombinase
MEKVIIYCRKSAKPKNTQEKMEEKQILSLESQENELKAYAKEKGFKVVKVFKENDSAYKTGRPYFKAMIDLLEAGKAESILVWHLTRISRNSYDGGKVIYLLDEGILKGIITPQKRYQNTGDDKFILSIELAMAKKSSDDTSSFVKRDIQTKADNGEFPGKAPLGYLNIDKEGRIAGRKFDSQKQIQLEALGRLLKRIETDPVEGLLVRHVFEEAAKGGYSLNELCDLAYKMGLRANRSGVKLVKASLKRMLQNPFYYGVFEWEGNLYTKNIKHEALISKELFDVVQERLDGKSFKKKEKVDYKFSGLMICGECQSSISGQLQKGIKYYYCTQYEARKNNCKCSQRKYFEESEIENSVVDLLSTLEIPKEFVEWGKAVIRDNHKEEVQLYESQRIALQNNLNKAKKKLHNLFQLKICPQNENGLLLSDSEYLQEKQCLQNEISEIEAKLADGNCNENSWLDRCEEFFEYTSKLQQNFRASSPNGKRQILESIGRIVMNDGKLAFQLNEPYLYAAKIVEATNSLGIIYEPEKELAVGNNDSYDQILNKWRNGRDSNPRPPQ